MYKEVKETSDMLWFRVEKSQTKSMYGMQQQVDPKYNKIYYTLKIQLGGYPGWQLIRLKEDFCEDIIEFIDEESLTVKIKVKYTHDDAGFHLTFYAETIIIIETPLLLPKMRFFKAPKFGQATERLPGHT